MAILQSRARYGLSAFSFLEPELPGSSYYEPGPQLDCAAGKFLPRSLRQPSPWRMCGNQPPCQGQCRPAADQLPAGYVLATWRTRRLRRQQINPEAVSIRIT